MLQQLLKERAAGCQQPDHGAMYQQAQTPAQSRVDRPVPSLTQSQGHQAQIHCGIDRSMDIPAQLHAGAAACLLAQNVFRDRVHVFSL